VSPPQDTPIRLVDVLTRTEVWLRRRGITAPRLEAELLLSHVLAMPRLQLYLTHDRPMAPEELQVLRLLVARRGDREPLSWITGSRGFHAIDLLMEPDVLDPRPDTETLVEALLSHLPADDTASIYVADVGCGSGAVGLAIASARPATRIYAVDRAEAPLRVTRRNVAALGLADRVAVLGGDLLDPIPVGRPIDWVVSNPPYIPSGEIDALMPEVSRHEPRVALDGGADGLSVIRRLIVAAAARAAAGLLLEVGAGQARPVCDLLKRSQFVEIERHTDLSGVVRVVGGKRPG